MGVNAWSKEHYYARGLEHGKKGEHRDIHDPNTWQWFHYNRGYEAGRAERNFELDHAEPATE